MLIQGIPRVKNFKSQIVKCRNKFKLKSKSLGSGATFLEVN